MHAGATMHCTPCYKHMQSLLLSVGPYADKVLLAIKNIPLKFKTNV